MSLNDPLIGIAVLLFGAVLTVVLLNLGLILKNLKLR